MPKKHLKYIIMGLAVISGAIEARHMKNRMRNNMPLRNADSKDNDSPLAKLQALAKLPADELRKPENQKKLVTYTKQVISGQSSDSGGEADSGGGSGTNVAVAMKQVNKEIREKLFPSN